MIFRLLPLAVRSFVFAVFLFSSAAWSAQVVTVPLCPPPGAWIVGSGPMAGVLNCRDPSTLVAVTPIPVDGVLLTQSEFDSLTSSFTWLQSSQAALDSLISSVPTLDWLVSSQASLQSLINGGGDLFDEAVAQMGFVGVLLLWATGFGIGLIVNIVKKGKS